MTHQFKVELLVTVVFLAPLPAIAVGDVTSEIHELCLKAVDYRGCVATQKGTPESVGNKCPTGYAFIGGGTCQKVDLFTHGGGGGDLGVTNGGVRSHLIENTSRLLLVRAVGNVLTNFHGELFELE